MPTLVIPDRGTGGESTTPVVKSRAGLNPASRPYQLKKPRTTRPRAFSSGCSARGGMGWSALSLPLARTASNLFQRRVRPLQRPAELGPVGGLDHQGLQLRIVRQPLDFRLDLLDQRDHAP